MQKPQILNNWKYFLKLFIIIVLWIFAGYFWGGKSLGLGYYIWLLVGFIIFLSYLFKKIVHNPYIIISLVTFLGTISLLVFALTFYVNYYMPHGQMYDTGDVICQNDGRGPCGEEYKEDMRFLSIPDWAKILRESGFWIAVVLGICASYIYSKNES